jgi:UDP-N-acetylmuramate dehydrogenase
LERKDFKKELKRFYQESALDVIKGKMIFDAPMSEYTSMNVGGLADVLFFPRNIDELRKIIELSREKNIPYFILGNGTNLIVKDSGIPGWVISLKRGFKRIEVLGKEIEAEAGVSLNRLIQSSIEEELTGLEPLIGIPGTVGGALRMNAGAWGLEMKDIVSSISFMNIKGDVIERDRKELKFLYRRLAVPDSWIILKARFKLEKGKREEIIKKIKSYSEMRKKTQPLKFASAGSIFKNPKTVSAGKLIEELGMKGFRLGEAMISNIHANFIVNLGKAKAKDVIDLIDFIEKRVYEEKGILLEREVKIVGA